MSFMIISDLSKPSLNPILFKAMRGDKSKVKISTST